MNSSIPYNKLEIKGALLIPSFSIYLLEIIYKEERLFYIGMTGDNFYPSARAAFHRISGHLELTERSTQNQLGTALKAKGIVDNELNNTTIFMHHFPIEGFAKWMLTESMKSELIKEQQASDEYLAYKKLQTRVSAFEDALICELREKLNDKLLNKTPSKRVEITKEFAAISDEIKKIIFSPLNTEGV